MELRHIHIANLCVSAANMRAKGKPDISAILPSVRARGIFVPLIVRPQDQQLLERAASAMEAVGGRIDAMIARSRSVVEQDREVHRNRIAFAVAGMVLSAILPGAIARSLPVNWAVPEQMAARMLGTDLWHAGQQMMIKADPDRWTNIVSCQRERSDPNRK